MITVDARGNACPLPIIKAKKAIEQLNGAGQVEVLVDNEIAVENLTKMAGQKGHAIRSEALEDGGFRAVITVEAGDQKPSAAPLKRSVVVSVGSNRMGEGDERLGRTLMKGFLFAQTQLDALPDVMLFYNGGAALTCEGSDSLEDLRRLEEAGVTILTCGTCLNFYGLTEKLQVGGVTNMYNIAELMAQADLVVKP